MTRRISLIFLAMILISWPVRISAHVSDSTTHPKQVCGYKVHRTRVEPKEDTSNGAKTSKRTGEQADEYDEDEPLLMRLGEPKLVEVNPLGITFDIPVILSPVKQQGEVERLVFEDMSVNETSVSIENYAYGFKLPNKQPLVLRPPIRIFVSTPEAVVRTIDEIFNSRDTWPVTGTIYVCGRFKKFLLKFKRAVPVELQTSIRNPLR